MDLDMDLDDIFKDDEDDFDNDFYQAGNVDENHFHIALSCISQSLKSQIINNSYDEVAICFFNTREKKNLQDLNGVFVFNAADRDQLDRPTARLIKEFDLLEGKHGVDSMYGACPVEPLDLLFNKKFCSKDETETCESFMKEIGSQYGIVSGSRDNSLYNAIWVAQALLRKGSAKTADKRILLFTNEDDPFGSLKGAVKMDMVNTTLQRAKDAQDLGISIEVLPLSRPEEEFNISLFYADLIGLEGDELAQFMPSAGERSVRADIIVNNNPYHPVWISPWSILCVTPKVTLLRFSCLGLGGTGVIKSLKATERSFICADTGALLQNSTKLFYSYKNENIKLSVEELSEIKRVSARNLRLLGFKPLSCLKDYHNLRPSTFLFPSEEDVIGSTCLFIALHRSMLRLERFAVAFYGVPSRPQLVALVAQEEIVKAGGQVEPPGMHMIYLPYSDDIRDNEEARKIPGVVKALEEFKLSIYGDHYDEEIENAGDKKESEASKKRKATSEIAVQEYAKYDWSKLADNGELKDLTVTELKYYLTANNIPVAGKKEALISKILSHMGK
ncbi:hypothetical protein F8388_016118 [Cannabis sativa]|uniref:SAP domain-containing protein n=1 Tax=Cannabis sativa TaxID=3483 RepID=A0A7J6FI42_CANSA|nr:hypothetical protein F8388_016118 [Cannabis sativa]KAF4390175.1 hypothetical protein G4B88_005093 [Cannabis sativa]